MKNMNVLTTLFVGIDVSSKTNVLCALDFHSKLHARFSVTNDQVGASELVIKLVKVLQEGNFQAVMIALESTSFYGIHIANFLSSDEGLAPYRPHVYCLNPKMIHNYKKSFIGLAKTDPVDAYVLADFARVGRIQTEPWRGSQFLALQRLTRHRLHLSEGIIREKTYMVANIFLKFSQLATLKKGEHPFSSNHTATAEAILTEMLSLEDICTRPVEELIDFVCQHSHNRYDHPEEVVKLLQKAARNSYRLDQCLYEPLTIAIASSFNCITAFQQEVKLINKAIEKTLRGLSPKEVQILQSIPGIGPVFSSGILAEIGSIQAFRSADALAKYAGIYWKEHQSGDYKAEDTPMSKAGNKYLRYYLIEAADSVRKHAPEFAAYYQKKFDESKTHHHKRALALTSRKLIRLIYGLLAKDQMYSADRVQKTS